jgi:hypothetical protein
MRQRSGGLQFVDLNLKVSYRKKNCWPDGSNCKASELPRRESLETESSVLSLPSLLLLYLEQRITWLFAYNKFP